MALAESNHHGAPRGGQKMARAGRVEREENYELRATGTLHSTLPDGSHGRLRGCCGASPRGAVAGWWRQR